MDRAHYFEVCYISSLTYLADNSDETIINKRRAYKPLIIITYLLPMAYTFIRYPLFDGKTRIKWATC